MYCVAPVAGSSRAGWYSSPSPVEQMASVNSSNESQWSTYIMSECVPRLSEPSWKPPGTMMLAPGVSVFTCATKVVSSSKKPDMSEMAEKVLVIPAARSSAE